MRVKAEGNNYYVLVNSHYNFFPSEKEAYIWVSELQRQMTLVLMDCNDLLTEHLVVERILWTFSDNNHRDFERYKFLIDAMRGDLDNSSKVLVSHTPDIFLRRFLARSVEASKLSGELFSDRNYTHHKFRAAGLGNRSRDILSRMDEFSKKKNI